MLRYSCVLCRPLNVNQKKPGCAMHVVGIWIVYINFAVCAAQYGKYTVCSVCIALRKNCSKFFVKLCAYLQQLVARNHNNVQFLDFSDSIFFMRR